MIDTQKRAFQHFDLNCCFYIKTVKFYKKIRFWKWATLYFCSFAHFDNIGFQIEIYTTTYLHITDELQDQFLILLRTQHSGLLLRLPQGQLYFCFKINKLKKLVYTNIFSIILSSHVTYTILHRYGINSFNIRLFFGLLHSGFCQS